MINIDFFDEDGDLASLSCIDRESAMKAVKDLKLSNLTVIGWYFSDFVSLQDKEWFEISELSLN